jgi:hypothetical protein
MEGLSPLHRRVAGIDVHRMLHVVTVLIEQPDGSIDIKHVPGRKTDMLDSEWLAVLARFGLVRGSFIPPKDLRELRLVSRYRRKLNSMCSSQINRLHKMLDDAGIKLGAVVSDIHGVSARAMVRGLIEGQSEAALLAHVSAGQDPSSDDGEVSVLVLHEFQIPRGPCQAAGGAPVEPCTHGSTPAAWRGLQR